MTKKFTFLFFLFSLVVSVGLVAAQYPSPEPPQEQEPMAKPQEQDPAGSALQQNQQISGVVEAVDHEKMTVTVKDEATNQTTEFSFGDTTSILKEGRTGSHNDLKKGDRVSVEVDSQNVATSIRIEDKLKKQENQE